MKNPQRVKAKDSKKNTTYKSIYLNQLPYFAVKWGKLTNAIAATEIGCSERTIINWRKKYPEFNQAISDPLGSALGKNYERVIGNMLHGRKVTERDEAGNVVKEITHSPTHQDLMLPKNMGYMITDRYAKNEMQTDLKNQRKIMQDWVLKYEKSEINLSQLLTKYYNLAIEPPMHLVKEHSSALAKENLEIIDDDDCYDQVHAASVLAAKQQRQYEKERQIAESAKKESESEIEKLRREIEQLKSLQAKT